jgi:cbb3-type cytochrome oxidase subunit 3
MVTFKKSFLIFLVICLFFATKISSVFAYGQSVLVKNSNGVLLADIPVDVPIGGNKEDVTGKIINPILNIQTSKTIGVSYFQMLLTLLIRLVYIIGGVYFFAMFLLGGIRWIYSAGDKGKLETAQKQITSALMGLAILLLSFAIIELIKNLFGFNLLQFTLPTL